MPTSLYLYFDRDSVLLYVGITNRGIKRNSEHNLDKQWWPYVARQEVRHLHSRVDAARAERELIAERRPPFNRQHNPGHEQLAAAYIAYADPPDASDESIWFSTSATDADIASSRDCVARQWRKRFGTDMAQCLCGNDGVGPEGWCGDSVCRIQATTLAQAAMLSFDYISCLVVPHTRQAEVSADGPGSA